VNITAQGTERQSEKHVRRQHKMNPEDIFGMFNRRKIRDEDSKGVEKTEVIEGNQEITKHKGNPCFFCGKTNNIPLTVLTDQEGREYLICHLCYNKARRTLEGLKVNKNVFRVEE